MKGGYMCIGYPDAIETAHASLASIVEDIKITGAETAYIFHNHDIAEPHYHFIFMWKKSILSWDKSPDCLHDGCSIEGVNCAECKHYNFVQFMQMHGLKAPKKHTSILYDYNTSRIKDIDSALAYLLHE